MYQGKDFLGHMVVFLLVLCEISILFSTVTVPIHILNNQCTTTLYILANIYDLCSF